MKRILFAAITFCLSVLVSGLALSCAPEEDMKLTLDQTSVTITVGEIVRLKANAYSEYRKTYREQALSWSSSKSSVATVSPDGVVTAVSPGEAQITVLYGDVSATCKVTVKGIEVTEVSLNYYSLSIREGETLNLVATVMPENATDKTVTWSSNNTSVATVSSSGTVKGIKAGAAVITAKAGSKTATCALVVMAKPIEVTGISLNYSSISIREGQSLDLVVTVMPENATDKAVTWTSSNTSVATVSSSGTVTGVKAGTATITAKAGSKSATCAVTVTAAVTGVSLNKSTLSLAVGETDTLTATITPSNATNKNVTWSSNATTVATVSSSGVVTAKAAGTATITVTTEDGSKTATCKVTVTEATVAVTGVSLNKSTLSLTVGETETLTATITPSNATNKNVTWSSNATTVATVSSSGLVTAKSAGTATITVKTSDGSKTATCKVTVTAATVAVTGVSLNKSTLSLTVGETEALTATVSPSNATNKNVTWSSSSTTVATVSSSGLVTAKSAGTATITVKTSDGAKTATCKVTVTAASVPVTGVSLSASKYTMTVGEGDIRLIPTVLPSDATDKSVTWSSSNESVATVSSGGWIHAIANGTTTITVRTNDGGKTATCVITVIGGTVPVSGISLSASSWTMTVGGSDVGLTATVSPSDATDKSVVWSSSDTSVATVTQDGWVHAVSAGTATITVRSNDGGKTASCSITVKSADVAVTGVSLNKSSLSMAVGDTQTLTATVSPSNATNKNVTWSSNNTSVATVSSSGVVTAKSAGSATITVKTVDGLKTATCSVTVQSKQTINGYEYVEMGDGLKWATMNVGASKPEEYGDYFAWGETSPKSSYDWSTYKYGKSSTTLTKYVDDNVFGTPDYKIMLEASDDAAMVNWGGSWRMPTDAEWTWLRTNCTWTWTTDYNGTGVAGRIVISNVSGYEGHQIFLPAAGGWNGNGVFGIGSNGFYWSSSLRAGNSSYAYRIGFYSDAINEHTTFSRYYGLSVRPVSGVSTTTVAVTGVSLNKSSLSMTVGDTQTLTATVSPSNATNKSVTWSSNNTSVATVSSSGVVTAKAAGTATITVTTNDGGKKATCSVSVQAQTVAVTGVTLNKSSLSMTVGDTQTLTATVSPSNATNKNVTWSSSNTSVATVSSSGVVTAKAAGTASITVTTNDGGKKATCSVSVQAQTVAVTGVSLNKSSLSMTVGDTQTLTATVSPSNATNKNLTWSSNNTSVATVSSSGVVTAKSSGSATITVKTVDGLKTATCSVTVQSQQQTIDGHAYVEMGDGLMWATMNVGATNSEEYGDYFAWGETSSKSNYDWSTYKYGTSMTALDKYVSDSSHGTVDNKTTLDAGDDAATVNWGGSWRMPTDAEWTWLMDNCTWTWTTDYNGTGVAGRIVTSSVTGYEGRQIFLPAAGLRDGAIFDRAGTYGGYWSSSLDASYSYYAYRVDFHSSGVGRGDGSRYLGRSVRPVSGVSTTTVAVTGVTLNKSSLSMTVGDTQTLTATVSPSNATNKNVTWSSSNTSIATVSSSGVVTAKAAGTATITVTTNDGGKKATCSVSVQAQTIAVTGVALNKSSLSMTVGDTQTLTATVSPSNATNKSVTWSSNNTSVATVSSSGVVTAKAAGTATITVKTVDGNKTATCAVTVTASGHAYVIMGVINGKALKWATMNVGATKPEEYGDYFAWGETSPKSNYAWSTYKYGTSETTLTKYVTNSSYGTVDNKTTLEASDDAATVNWGGSWRMPTDAEWTWLRENCTWIWTTNYNGTGVAGDIVISNVSGYEGHQIFLPAAGGRGGTSVDGAGTYGDYWSSSLGAGDSDIAYVVYFGSSFVYRSIDNRFVGRSVRPVSE